MPQTNAAALARRNSFPPPTPRIGHETRAFEQSLGFFIREGWSHALEPASFVPNWHTDLIADYLTAAVDREIKGPLIFTMPPMYGKSIEINVFLPAWLWAQQVPDEDVAKGRRIRKDAWRGPGVRFASISYGQNLSNRDSDKCRNLIESPWYRQLVHNAIAWAGGRLPL